MVNKKNITEGKSSIVMEDIEKVFRNFSNMGKGLHPVRFIHNGKDVTDNIVYYTYEDNIIFEYEKKDDDKQLSSDNNTYDTSINNTEILDSVIFDRKIIKVNNSLELLADFIQRVNSYAQKNFNKIINIQYMYALNGEIRSAIINGYTYLKED